jgi:lysophospholipase L1-like esterase
MKNPRAAKQLLVASALVAVVAFTLAAPSGRAAASPLATPTEYYMAMGASLVTGVGSTGGADYVNDLFAYSQPLIPGLQLNNLGCSGETTTTMLHGGLCKNYTTGSQLGDAEAFLKAHPGQVAFVTIDIGADDVLGCAPGGVINQTCFESGLSRVEANLPQIVSGLRAASSTVPIVGMTYYDPYLEFWLNGTSGEQEARMSVPLLKQLNSALTSVYSGDGVALASAYKQFGTPDFRGTTTWDGQQVPTNVATICNWTWMCTPGGPTIHANNTGYAQLANAFEKVLVVPPSITGTPPPSTVDQPYSFAFAIGGVPAARVSHVGKIPKGLDLSKDGVLSGVPTQAGTYPFTIKVSNRKGGTVTALESVTVASASAAEGSLTGP